MEQITKGKKGFNYLKEMLKNPDILGIVVTDEEGNAVYEELSFSLPPQDRKEILGVFKNLNFGKKTVVYIFTKNRIVMISKNPPKFKGFLITFSRKKSNIGLLRVYHHRFIEL